MKKKVLKTVSIIMAAVIVSVFTFIFVVPKVYLAHKYDTKITDYKVEKFYPGYFMYDIDFWATKWHNTKWDIKTKNGNFKVIISHQCLYDDYQRNEIEQWILEELQKKINKNICCIPISSSDIYGKYDSEREFKEKPYFKIIKEKNKVWKEDEIDELIKQFCDSQEAIYFYFGKDISVEDIDKSMLKEINTTIDKLNKTYDKTYSNYYMQICLEKPLVADGGTNLDFDKRITYSKAVDLIGEGK